MKWEKWRTCDSIKEAKAKWGVCVWLCQARVGLLFREAIKAIWLPDEVLRKGQKKMYKVFLMLQRNLLPMPLPFSLHHLLQANDIPLTTTICRNVLCFRDI